MRILPSATNPTKRVFLCMRNEWNSRQGSLTVNYVYGVMVDLDSIMIALILNALNNNNVLEGVSRTVFRKYFILCISFL